MVQSRGEISDAAPLAPLLVTKLFIPPVHPDLVPRPRLIKRLSRGRYQKLSLVSAPAGFGKSSLLVEWIAHCERLEPKVSVAWLSLDEGDNDPVCFLGYLIAALRQVDGCLGRTTSSLLGGAHLPPVEPLITALVNDIAALSAPFILVLDDYHTIHLAWIHHAVEYLIDHQPAQMHLVLATRHDPPLPLPRLRVRGQVTEIRDEDLRFTTAETTTFFGRALESTLDPNQVAALQSRTEGWVAGLQLAALSLHGRPAEGIAEFVALFGGSHRHVMDYLAGEVLAQQPEEVRQFLLQTAILDRFTPALCNAVTGRDDSSRLLRCLEQANLFLVPLDDQRLWYRYHRLLADFLRAELDPGSERALHLRAAHWLAANDLWPEAVKHALASRDVAEAAQTIILAAEPAFRNAAFTSLLAWLDALPDDLVRADDRLATYKGLLLFLTGRCSLAAEYAAAAGHVTRTSGRGRLHCLQAHVALFQGALDEAIELGRRALDTLEPGDHLFRGLALNLLGQALEWKGDVAGAVEVYRSGASAGLQAGNHVAAMVMLINLVFALNELGHLQEAAALCQQVIQEQAVHAPLALPLAEGLYLAWGWLSYEAGDLSLAREQARRALQLCERVDIADGISRARFILAQVHLAGGEVEAVQEVAREMRRFAVRRNLEPSHAARFAALEAMAHLGRGEITAAAHWAEQGQPALSEPMRHWLSPVYFTRVRVLLAQKRPEQAEAWLAVLERAARQNGWCRTLLTVRLLQALTHQALGHPKEAQAHLEAAVQMAAAEGYRRALLDEGQPLADLLPRARHVAPAFVDGVLLTFRGEVEPSMPPLLEPLSDRELQILRLIAAGRSNPEIASLLYLSPNTVKWHVKNLYGKLQVSGRVEAAARAAELNLL